ncbi:MAG: division/cell wall cluster transcriptional repressor MraZ [Nitrospirota bacterium]
MRHMFFGQYKHTIDAKGRLSIPGKYRELLAQRASGTVVVTKDPEQCLAILPLDEWRQRAAKIQAIPNSGPAVKDYKRFLFSEAADCALDGQGRILIPPELRRYAGLERDVMLVGVDGHMEAWSLARWATKSEQVARDLAQIVNTIAQYGV